MNLYRIKCFTYKIINWTLAKIESSFYINWYNPFATIWLNFRSLPLNIAFKLPISVYGRPRIYNLSGSIQIEGKVSLGMISFNKTRTGAPSIMNLQSEIVNQGTIIFRGKGIIGTGNKIRVASKAVLDIGSDFMITDMINIGCYESIIIGNRTWIVHRSQVFDANYHYVANFKNGKIPKWSHPIIIGNDCWICNSSTIMGKAIIPDATIVASNSLINRDYSNIEPNSLIGGVPARTILTGVRRVNNINYDRIINKYYKDNPNGMFIIPQDWSISDCSKLY